jgi:hypothetical protein
MDDGFSRASPGTVDGSNDEFVGNSEGGVICDELRMKNFMGLFGKCALVGRQTSTEVQLPILACTAARANGQR